LAKVAIGIVVAKSVGGMLGKGATGSSGGSIGSDGRYGGNMSPGRKTTGLEDMMGDVFKNSPTGGGLGGAANQDPFGKPLDPVVANEPATQRGGGLGDLLEQLGGAAGRPSGGTQGGLGDLLGQLTKGGSGGLGDLLGGLVAGAAGDAKTSGSSAGSGTKGFGDMLNDAFATGGEPQVTPTPEHEAAAGLMLRAMIQAAKSDGRIDADEQKKLMANLTDATPQEMQFVQAELRAPVDVAGLCRQVPGGLAPQVYGMSLMAINLDNRAEAQYLHDLATGLGIGKQAVNQIHAQVGVAPLYS
jgi:uncharacterized membrane protein YebE (DUF533 family)